MKMFMRCFACVAVLGLSASRASSAEAFSLIHLSDMMREDAYEIMSADEFKVFLKNLQLEERCFPKALQQASEEWRQDEMNKTTPFPSGRIVPRKLIGMPEKFADRAKAEERLMQYEDRESHKRLREIEKNGKRTPTPAETVKADREIEKVLTTRRAAELVATKLSALTGIPIVAATDPFDKKKPDEKAPEVKKPDEKAPPDKKADKKAPPDKKEAGAALDKAL